MVMNALCKLVARPSPVGQPVQLNDNYSNLFDNMHKYIMRTIMKHYFTAR